MWWLLLRSARAFDSDGDGVRDRVDACDLRADPDQRDTDADGVGDACDVCPGSGAGLELLAAPIEVAHLDRPSALLGADVDGDGDHDLVIGTSTAVAWVENLGAGLFGPVVVAADGMQEVRDLELGDLDGDGVEEVVAADARGVVVFPIAAGLGARRDVLTAVDVVDVAFGRLDGDGWPDLVVGRLGSAGWHPGVGSGAFGPERRLAAAFGSVFHVAVGDLDHDADLDVVCAGSGTDLFPNDGDGPTAGERLSSVAGELALGELSGDGSPDVVVASREGVSLLLSSAPGIFAAGPVTPLAPVVRAAAVGELDGVAPADVVVVSDRVLLTLLGGTEALTVGPELRQGAAVAAVDLTGDGLDDVVVADLVDGSVRVAPSQARCGALDTDGDGLTDALELLVHGTEPDAADSDADGVSDGAEVTRGLEPLEGDSDGDGRLDGADVCPTDPADPDDDADGICQADDLCPLFADPTQADADGDGWGDVCDLCPGFGVGLGAFGEALVLAPGDAAAGSTPPVDLDLDGDLDLFWPGVGIRENLGHGTFAVRPAPTTGAAVVFVDLDSDGLPDLVTDAPDGLRVARSLGGLAFAASIEVAPGVRADDLAAGDLDGDGDQDLVACSAATKLVALRNKGGLQLQDDDLWSGDCRQVAAGDLDGDGDADVVADSWLQGTFWFESGAGFRRHRIDHRSDLDDLVLGDLDGDGDPDLATSVAGHGVTLAENRGGAFVQRWWWPASAGEVSRLALGDLDGDGDLDVVDGRGALGWRVNLAPWAFAGVVTVAGSGAGVVVTGDLDGDGDDDPVLGGPDGWRWFPADASCALADVDGDGLTDAEESTVLGTDPRAPDTDGGGAGDGDEVELGTDPLDPADDLEPADTGLADGEAPRDSSEPELGRGPGPEARSRSATPGGCAIGVALPTWLVLMLPLTLIRRAGRWPRDAAGRPLPGPAEPSPPPLPPRGADPSV